MDEIQFSVIVPIYNSAQTIRRCLDSILNQKRDDIQLLLINDGSEDDSDSICCEYVEKYSCIEYFKKTNGGVSSARNIGLEHACGKYVLFVDSDDYVTGEYFSSIEREVKERSTDILQFGNLNDKDVYYPTKKNSIIYYTANQTSKYIASVMMKNKFNTLWSKCFSNSVISDNGIRFNEAIEIAEDLDFIFSYIMHVSSIKMISDALYVVDESNQSSLSRKSRPDLWEKLLLALISMKKTLEQADLAKTTKKTYEKVISRLFYRSVYSISKELNKGHKKTIDRTRQLNSICKEYCKQEIIPLGLVTLVMALPVRFKMVHLIDSITRIRNVLFRI